MEAQIEKIEIGDIEEILRIADIIFPETIGFNEKYIGSYLAQDECREVSVKLVLDGKIVGFYVLKPEVFHQVKNYFPEVNFYDGLQGIALGVLPEYRGTGLGKKLIEYPYSLKQYSYIFGEHFKHLNNMKDWEKRRLIVNPDNEIFISLGRLKPASNEIPVFNLINQTEGWNCGPTALLMAYKPMKGYKDVTLEEVSKLCGADSITGTTDVRMKAGLNALGIMHYQSSPVGVLNDHIYWLKCVLNTGNVFLLRGLVNGVKHWVLVTSYSAASGRFKIYDPWLGEYGLSSAQVKAIWKPRDYDGFVVLKENY